MTNPDNLLTVLRESVRTAIRQEQNVAIAYSGGLDSSLVAKLAAETAVVRCYTCAIEGSFDAVHVADFAAEDELELAMISLNGDSLGELVGRTRELLGSDDPIRISYTIPVLGVLEHCAEGLVLCGSGADELFGGYARYVGMDNPGRAMSMDTAKMLAEDTQLKALARTMGKRMESPFVSEAMSVFSSNLPLALKITGSDRKILLREAASSLGLHSHDRPKKAAQYSSGVMKEMKRQAKKANESLIDWVREQTGPLEDRRSGPSQSN